MNEDDLLGAVDELWGLQEGLLTQLETATVMYVDLSESTRYKEERGHIRGIAKNIQFNTMVSETLTDRAAELAADGLIDEWDVVKYMGDEVMAYFAGEESSRAAVDVGKSIQTALRDQNRMQQDPLEESHAKVGINTGEVLFAQYHEAAPEDPQGLPVDIAARLTSLAKPGQILIGGAVAEKIDHAGDIRLGDRVTRDLQGIEEPTELLEVDWGDGLKNIAMKELQSISTIDANPSAVEQYIGERDLLSREGTIDLSLYTFETLAATMRSQLTRTDTDLNFRILIRNPAADRAKADHVRGSMRTIREILHKNENLQISVRFYDSAPMLRTYAFHPHAADEPLGLCGIYKYDPSAPSNFVGAEDNQLIACEGGSVMEEKLLDAHTSRFRYNWSEQSEERALIFDLDGLLIDTMPAYEEAWLSAFQQFGLNNVPGRTFYEREGEASRVTVREVYEEHRGKEPSEDIITAMINRRDEVLEDVYEPTFFPYAKTLIERLSRKYMQLCLVTGSERLEKKFGDDIEFFNAFDHVVTGADKSAHDSPQNPFSRALELLNMSPEQCRVIENSPLGVEAAQAAGIPTMVVNDNSPLPARRFKKMDVLRVFSDLHEAASVLLLMDTNVPPNQLLEFID